MVSNKEPVSVRTPRCLNLILHLPGCLCACTYVYTCVCVWGCITDSSPYRVRDQTLCFLHSCPAESLVGMDTFFHSLV